MFLSKNFLKGRCPDDFALCEKDVLFPLDCVFLEGRGKHLLEKQKAL
jgi:hypothetical protein